MTQEFIYENAHRAYPFVEDSNLGVLPPWLLLDIRLVNPNRVGKSTSLLECVHFSTSSNEYVLKFEYRHGSGVDQFDISVIPGSPVSVGSVTTPGGSVVKYVVCGSSQDSYSEVVPGEYDIRLRVLNTRLIEIDSTRKLQSFAGAHGVIHLKPGYNTEARIEGNTIIVETGNGIGLGHKCDDADGSKVVDCSKSLLFINGQHADTNGNININGGAGVTVQIGKTVSVGGAIMPAITIRADADKLKEF